MRNGNSERWRSGIRSSWVQSNLWGMETCQGASDPRFLSCSIESMRNGNFSSRTAHKPSSSSSIESMRNGNHEGNFYRHRLHASSIESMRNGNLFGSACEYPQKTGSIESMRNGNSSQVRIRTRKRRWFNRIYEEWKQLVLNAFSMMSPTFNRIYEEWKQFGYVGNLDVFKMFNRIYEEWKHFTASVWIFPACTVQSNLWGMETSKCRGKRLKLWTCSIESMRNGNPFFQLLIWYSSTGSIESMRNGNSCGTGPRAPRSIVQSNLWGMETFVNPDNADIVDMFNRIYEEWKPEQLLLSQISDPSSIESMRNGNCSSMPKPSLA